MFSPFQHHITSVEETAGGESNGTGTCTKLAHTTMVSTVDSTASSTSACFTKEDDVLTVAGTSDGTSPTSRSTGISGMQIVRRSLEDQGISGEAENIIMAAWRPTTQKQWAPYLAKWSTYCDNRKVDTFSPGLKDVLNFLTELFETGIGYSAINTAKSALTAIVQLPNGQKLGSHPLMLRFMKGIFEKRPSLPRYSTTWDVASVLDYLKAMELKTLGLKELTMKLALLLCLLTGQRLQTLSLIKLSGVDFQPSNCTIYVQDVLKTTAPSRHIQPIVLDKYDTGNLCVVKHLEHYIALTRPLRGNCDQLLISYQRPHKPVSTDTLSRWIKHILHSAGVDTKVFGAHSTRGAATSAAAKQGLPLEAILQAANWHRAGTFAKFYKRTVPDTKSFGAAVLAAATRDSC